jgi:hypothetical protein
VNANGNVQRIFLRHWSVANRTAAVRWISWNTIALKKVLDKGMNADVTSAFVFVGAYTILYMKSTGMTNNEEKRRL